MALPVDVESIAVIRDVRGHLARFGEDAKHALAAAEMEIRRMVDWLTNDQRLYWQAEIRRRHDYLNNAKSELHRKRTGAMHGNKVQDADQKENVRVAKAKLEEAEDKLERIRRWIPQLQQAVMEYQSQARPLADMVDGDLEKSLASLERMIIALEQYVSMKAPTLAPEAPASSGSTATAQAATAPAEPRVEDEARPETVAEPEPVDAETPEG
jgi:hypothetical protein